MKLNCPNCSNDIPFGNICPRCGIDVVLFEKTIKISDVLYNKGLNLAKVRDLWGASEALTKSIQFNKNNYYARNLLGLVHYEAGRIGDALKHWIISASLVQQDNPATRYINHFQQEGKGIDLYNDAIKMYNQALVYIQQKSDDMAIIQLKKAIEINPNLIDAMNLLAFCYLIQNETSKASELVDKILELDINNPIALNYYQEIHHTKKKAKPVERVDSRQQAVFTGNGANKISAEDAKKGFGNRFYFAEIISFLIGGLCTLALFYALIIPGTVRDLREQITGYESQIETLEADRLSQVTALTDRITDLEEKEAQLTRDNNELTARADAESNARRVNTAATMLASGDAEEAASIIHNLGSLDPSLYSEDVINTYETVKSQSYAAAEQSHFSAGEAAYRNENYEEAKRSLTTCLYYSSENSTLIDDAYYYLGLIAEAEEDFEQAINYYTNIDENYTDSNVLTNARNRLDALRQADNE